MMVEVYQDNAFSKKFTTNKSAVNWKEFSSVQTCLKCAKGLGIPYYVKFHANVNLKSPEDEIVYDFRSLGEDVELIQGNK